ncbi:MAG TPA: TetR/AcrR family transcriptional regulator [Solirubrobacterales bacterium]|jgi:AcrR family transcriptional regulator|nr:TetR/AcrR family transcriptional regulator [Solirubrobacterales bacterium]
MAAAIERIYEAALDLVTFKGYDEIDADQIAARAGVPRADFDRLFASKEECALALFDSFMGDCIEYVRAAYRGEPQWPDSLRAAAYALADWLDAHPREVRFGGLGILWVSDLAQVRREQALEHFARMADGGRAGAPDPALVPDSAAAGVVGAVAAALARRADQRDEAPRGSARSFVPQLMYLAVLPYRGEEAAARELSIPPPAPADPQP